MIHVLPTWRFNPNITKSRARKIELPRRTDWRNRRTYFAAGQGLQEPALIDVYHESVQIQFLFQAVKLVSSEPIPSQGLMESEWMHITSSQLLCTAVCYWIYSTAACKTSVCPGKIMYKLWPQLQVFVLLSSAQDQSRLIQHSHYLQRKELTN